MRCRYSISLLVFLLPCIVVAQFPLERDVHFDRYVDRIAFKGVGNFENYNVILYDRDVQVLPSQVPDSTNAEPEIIHSNIQPKYTLWISGHEKKVIIENQEKPVALSNKYLYTVVHENDTVSDLRMYDVLSGKRLRSVRSYLPHGNSIIQEIRNSAGRLYFVHKYNFTGKSDKRNGHLYVYSDSLTKIYQYNFHSGGEAELNFCGNNRFIVSEFNDVRQVVYISIVSLGKKGQVTISEVDLASDGCNISGINVYPGHDGFILSCRCGTQVKSQLRYITFSGKELWKREIDGYAIPFAYWPKKAMFLVGNDYGATFMHESTGQSAGREKFDSDVAFTLSGNYACFTSFTRDSNAYRFTFHVSDGAIVRSFVLPYKLEVPEVAVQAIYKDVVAIVMGKSVLVYDMARRSVQPPEDEAVEQEDNSEKNKAAKKKAVTKKKIGGKKAAKKVPAKKPAS